MGDEVGVRVDHHPAPEHDGIGGPGERLAEQGQPDLVVRPHGIPAEPDAVVDPVLGLGLERALPPSGRGERRPAGRDADPGEPDLRREAVSHLQPREGEEQREGADQEGPRRKVSQKRK